MHAISDEQTNNRNVKASNKCGKTSKENTRILDENFYQL